MLKSKTVFRGPLFNVISEQVAEPGGYTARRDVVQHPGSVVVLAVKRSRGGPQVLLERQYRHATGRFLWELPAGKRDAGETPLAGAKRELLEETGYSASRWRRILRFYVSPGFLSEHMWVFLAQGLEAGTAQPEWDEAIHARFFPLATALRMIERGSICDAKTVAPLLWLQLNRKTLK